MLDDDAMQVDLIAVLDRSRFNPEVSSASLAAQVIDLCRIYATPVIEATAETIA